MEEITKKKLHTNHYTEKITPRKLQEKIIRRELHWGNHTEKIILKRKELHREIYTEENAEVYTWTDKQGSDSYKEEPIEQQRKKRQIEKRDKERETKRKKQKEKEI